MHREKQIQAQLSLNNKGLVCSNSRDLDANKSLKSFCVSISFLASGHGVELAASCSLLPFLDLIFLLKDDSVVQAFPGTFLGVTNCGCMSSVSTFELGGIKYAIKSKAGRVESSTQETSLPIIDKQVLETGEMGTGETIN